MVRGTLFLLFASFAVGAPAERLRVGFAQAPPISYRAADGQARGFAVDVLNEAARREGVEVEWHPIAGNEGTEAALSRGAIDVVPAARVTPARKQDFYVSEPWWSSELILLVPAQSRIHRMADLGGARLAMGAPVFSAIVQQSFPPLTAVPFATPQAATDAVCAGDAQAALLAHSELREFVLARPHACRDTTLRWIDTPVTAELSIMANHAHEAVAIRLRRRIDQMALDGKLAALAAANPPVPTSGAVRLADALRLRYERRTWRTVLVASIALLALAALYLASRRRAQRALAASEERYRIFFHQAAVGTVETDHKTGHLLNVNQRFCDILGYTREELLRKTFSDITCPADRETSMAAYQRLSHGEVSAYTIEKRYVRRDGIVIWARADIAGVRDRAGKLLYTTAVVQDISERKRSDDALRRSEERYRALVEANPAGVAVVSAAGDDYGRLQQVNQAYAELVGYSREEIESGAVRWADLTPREWRETDEHAIREALSEGHSHIYEKEYVRKDGARIPVLMGCAAARDGEVVIFALDVSDRKRLEKQVKWLSGLLPICAACKRVRDEEGHWHQLESYMNSRISADFSHGLCPECLPLYVYPVGKP